MSQLRKLKGSEQVAAVCYRVRSGNVEFLLVQTRGGRWTFPKGSVESGLTHAQAAALEAFEEAGVHGRMEEASLTQYVRRGRSRVKHSASITVHAHLCEVLRLGSPQEFKRNPTWFSSEKAKRRLRQDRTPDCGAELARVVDCAVAHIGRALSETVAADDALQEVQFEAFEEARDLDGMEEASFARDVQREGGDTRRFAAMALAVNAHLCEVLQFGPPQESKRNPNWLAAGKAKARSGDRGMLGSGAELTRPVDRAVIPIQRPPSGGFNNGQEKRPKQLPKSRP